MFDAVPFFFALGMVAKLAKSELKLPVAVFEALSIYLLLAIGLKGGVQLASNAGPEVAQHALLAILLGATIPLFAFPLFRWRFSRFDAASLAAHYGSVSIVTFAVGVTVLDQQGISHEGHLALLAALMEVPAILVATVLARLGGPQPPAWRSLLHEVLANKSVLLLLGGIAIGWLAGAEGTAALKPLFTDLFKGALCLFLLEMGLVAASRLGDLRQAGRFLIGCAIALPLLNAGLGLLAAVLMGLSLGGTVLLMVLAASASYIAAPTAMRLAVPEANPALGIAAALGVTFPFNVLAGIPLYLAVASQVVG